jgi:hypothetical protein
VRAKSVPILYPTRQGRDNAIAYLREHPEITAQVGERIISRHGIGLALAVGEE